MLTVEFAAGWVKVACVKLQFVWVIVVQRTQSAVAKRPQRKIWRKPIDTAAENYAF